MDSYIESGVLKWPTGSLKLVAYLDQIDNQINENEQML